MHPCKIKILNSFKKTSYCPQTFELLVVYSTRQYNNFTHNVLLNTYTCGYHLVLPPRASMTDCSPWFVLSIEVARCSWKKAPRYIKFLHAVQVTPHSGSMMLRSSFRTIEGLVHYYKKLQAVIDNQGGST